MDSGLILLCKIRREIIVVGIMVTEAVFITRKVIILREAVSLMGLIVWSSFMAFRPNGVAAFPSPKIFITILVPI